MQEGRSFTQHPIVTALAARLAARVPDDEAPWPEARFAAVAAVLRVVDEPELLFIKRADVAHDPWSGHIAFPGGRSELSDLSLLDTAIRETREELSIEIEPKQVLGRLDDLAPRSRALPPIIVRPYVAIVSKDAEIIPSREVAASVWVPLRTIQSIDAETEYTIATESGVVRFPAYALNGHVVWGLTERIVRQLMTLCSL
ncbi:MAG: CoA pyrophosphatase [Gemmatimonadaceae bacterium]|nr:CoA pyrophosphatase [Gemmatimonadaceae bacterium]